MDESVAEAHIHRPEHRVLGRVLRPLSLRHLLWLEALKSPLVVSSDARAATGDDTIGPDDLLLAVRVCQCSTDRQLQDILTDTVSLRDRLHILRLAWRTRGTSPRAQRRAKRWWTEELAKWQAYWEDYMVPPALMPNATKRARAMQLPWQLMSAGSLIRRGVPRDTAWWIPVGEALWLDLAMHDAEGAEYSLLTDERRASLRDLGHDV